MNELVIKMDAEAVERLAESVSEKVFEQIRKKIDFFQTCQKQGDEIEFITRAEAAKLFKISLTSFDAMRAAGKIPHADIGEGRRQRWNKERLIERMKRTQEGEKHEAAQRCF